MKRILCTLVVLAGLSSAEIVDGVVAIVGAQPIKHSDVLQDLRLTAFLNGVPVDASAERQQEAANRLIDQVIIRVQLNNGGYNPPDESKIEALLKQVKKRYPSEAAFSRAVVAANLTETSLQWYLGWQVMVLEFIDQRFGTAPEDPVQESNDQFITWLDAARKNERITIRTERLK
ncbi:MAG: hypothetical protein ABIR70_21380 [Bryobacteraceae bacterium]